MPRSTKPRRAYRAKPVDRDPITLAISAAAKLQPDQQVAVMAPVRRAFDEMRRGAGSEAAICELSNAMNIGEQLAARNIANNHIDKFRSALEVLVAVLERGTRPGGSFTLRGPELAALDDGLWMLSIQLQHCSQREAREAIADVKRVVQGALAGAASPSTRVYMAATGVQQQAAKVCA